MHAAAAAENGRHTDGCSVASASFAHVLYVCQQCVHACVNVRVCRFRTVAQGDVTQLVEVIVMLTALSRHCHGTALHRHCTVTTPPPHHHCAVRALSLHCHRTVTALSLHRQHTVTAPSRHQAAPIQILMHNKVPSLHHHCTITAPSRHQSDRLIFPPS